VFRVSSSPSLLKDTIRHHIKRYSEVHPEFVEVLQRSIYVNDVSFGADDEEVHMSYTRSPNKCLPKEGLT